MYEIECDDLSYDVANDVDSSYSVDDVDTTEIFGNIAGVAAIGGVSILVCSLMINELGKTAKVSQAAKPYYNVQKLVDYSFSTDQVLSQVEANSIYAQTQEAMESISTVSEYTSLTGAEIRDEIFNRVLLNAGEDIDLSDVEKALLQRLKDMPVKY